MKLQQLISNALGRKTTTAYVWLLACILLFGAHVHIANMLGWNGRPWPEFPLLWRLMDVLLLLFDVVVAFGLIYRKPQAVLAFFAGMLLLQVVPFTVFRQHFVATAADARLLDSLLTAEILIMLVLLILLVLQGRSPVIVEDE